MVQDRHGRGGGKGGGEGKGRGGLDLGPFCRSAPRRESLEALWGSGLRGGTGLFEHLFQTPPPHAPSLQASKRRSRSSAVMHVTPELEVLSSNPGGVGTQCPRR